MRIWLVNPFEASPAEGYPRGRYAALSAALARRGHEVTWWSSDFSHFKKAYRPPADAGATPPPGLHDVTLRSVHAPAYRGNASLSRVASHAGLAFATARAMLREASQPDLIMATSPPLEVSAAVAELARRRGARFCLDVGDVWPDSFALLLPPRLRVASSMLLWPHQRLLRYALRRADALVAISETYLSWALAHRGSSPRDQGIFPWASDRPLEPVRRELAADRLVAVFCGTLGITYDFDMIFAAAEALAGRSRHDVEFRIVGEGPRRGELERRAAGVASVKIVGPLYGEALDEEMRRAHVGLCTYVPDAPQSLPIKLYQYLAWGLPVLETLDGEMGSLLKSEEMGLTVRSAGQLADSLVGFREEPLRWQGLAEAALAYSREHDLAAVSGELADFCERVVERGV